MIGKKCSLCGGKLNGRKICQECGLDNSKSEKYYKINRSSCDGQPLTHVHHEPKTTKSKSDNDRDFKDRRNAKPKGGCMSVFITIIIIFMLGSFAMGAIFGYLEDTDNISETWEDEYTDPYENLDIAHDETGVSAEYFLTSGDYIVGVHIPAGDYIAGMEADYDSVEVLDYENGIFLYEYMGKDAEVSYLGDLRLFDGAIVKITTETQVHLVTENAQSEVSGVENPLTYGWFNDQGDDTCVAGVNFEPGVYDLSTADDYGTVSINIYDETGNEIEYRSINLGTEASEGTVYKNLVLPEGAEICIEDAIIDFQPSEMIRDTDYLSYYQW